MRQNLHTHTDLVHGTSSLYEMAQAAIDKGFESLGFSEHAYMDFCQDYALDMGQEKEYYALVDKARAMFPQLEIFLGMEIDSSYMPEDISMLDYFIGSVHYLVIDGEHVSIDGPPTELKRCFDRFGGAVPALKRYYDSYVDMAQRYRPDIFGHFDVFTKCNRGGALFDQCDPRYMSIALDAVDAILDIGGVIEVNTAGIYRGYIRQPNPASFILKRIRERNGSVAITCDAHYTAALGAGYEEAAEILRSLGFDHQVMLTKNGFTGIPL